MITVERLSDDKLSVERWEFSPALSGSRIFLYFYGRGTRPSTRHKFQFNPKDRFVRSDQRRYNSGIDRETITIPDDVKAEAIEKIVANLVWE